MSVRRIKIAMASACPWQDAFELAHTRLRNAIAGHKRHYFMAKGIHAGPVKEEFLEHAAEEQKHADRIAERIVQLGGAPNFSPEGLLSPSHSEYVESTTLLDMITEDLVAERIAIDSYREIALYFADFDTTTRRMIEDIQASEEEHADAVVAPDWIERNCMAIDSGADVVCGRVVLHPSEAAVIPAHLQADDALECRLIELLDRIEDRLDPDPADPLPRHTEAAGASLAVTQAAFRRGGGIPALASGEDRAFVRALARIDARIRHDPSVLVSVSGRMIGRAPGGMADTIRRRMQRQDEFADEQVEPAVDAYRRYDFRSRVRRAWWRQSLPAELAIDLGIAPHLLDGMLGERYFGSAWACIEAASPFLTRRRVRFSELARQIDQALQLLEHDGAPDLVCDLGSQAP